jgi:uncharacterized protein (DUF1810 family)
MRDRDAYDLDRFVRAQAPVLAAVAAELHAGRKQTHWMWFVFPQIVGLGRSDIARRYAISGLGEAGAYLAHPVLGPRLRAHAAILLELPATATATSVFGATDAMKLRSSMTLFDRAAGEDEYLFGRVIARYFGGDPDEATVRLLVSAAS